MAQSVNLEAADAWASDLRASVRNFGSRRDSIRNWGSSAASASGRSTRGTEDDEEALKWAALEKLPTYDRLRTSILKSYDPGTGKVSAEQVDVRHLGLIERQSLMDKLIKLTEQDNEKFLKKLRRRIDSVGIEIPTVELRYQNLKIDAKCFIGGRALPTISNSIINAFEAVLGLVGIQTAKSAKLSILNDVSGIIKPGRMTLLLGPPGSGKTTLLLALAGKLDPALKVSGKVTYNGHELHEFVPQKTSAYISQYDLHVGEMTVRETLEFSAKMQGVGTSYELLSELIKREKRNGIIPEADIDLYMKAVATKEIQSEVVTDYVLKILGLDVCADTMVGDEMRRGISGGQKKRVTTGEMIVGPTKTLFMDEISTGLDSSTTFQIVNCLQQFVHVLEGTILMSLLQPAPETYNLFDDVLLISEGQVVYHGPREHIVGFFEACGFKCPDRKGTADFLQEVTSLKDQAQYWADKRKPYRYVTVKEFVDAFKSFHVGHQLALELSRPFDKSKSHSAALVHDEYSISKKQIFKASFDREVLLKKRNSFVYVFKTVQIIIIAMIAMTVFLRTEMHQKNVQDGTLYLGALFFGMITIMFNGFAELAMTISRLPVFYKQRDLKFYPAWAYSLPTFVLSLPISVVEVAAWTCTTYYVMGYAPEASRFFKQFLLLFLVHQMSNTLFRLIASVCRTMTIANTGGSFALLIIFILGGFIIPRTQIPKWWIWGYWISPLTYGENAISVNELLAPRWKKPFGNSTLGETILRSRGIFPDPNWYWIGVAALFGFTILFNIGFTIALTYLNPLEQRQSVMSEESLEAIEASQQGRAYEPKSRSKSRRSKRSTGREMVEMDNYDMEAATGVAPKRGMTLPFKPLTISFGDVSYYVDMPAEMKEQGVTESRLQLLRGITGSFRPGILTSLMGVSGAGKTTLMDVLAGRKTGGYIEGDIRISGFPKQQETFARVSGYCEQTDIHSPQVTVHESLVFSAWLRLPQDISSENKMKFVEDVMQLVELDNLRDAIVGIPGVSGLSTEQRKRLTIAVELVANPSIIFMDEPTSGLDARAAAIVMRTVRNTVDTGRTVVCTIHQPSIDIFEAFDELLLLKRGGQVIYAGPLGRQSKSLVQYFEAIPGVPTITDGYNPATWMLEVSSNSAEQRLGVDFSEIYHSSALHQRNKTLVEQLKTPAEGTEDLFFPTQYSQSTVGQFKSLLWKQNITYWRSPDYNTVRLCFTLVAALLFGSIFWNRGTKRDTETDLFTVMGAMYGATIFLGIQNCSTVQPVVATERTVFYRERAAGLYAAMPYALSQVLIEIPYILVQAFLYGGLTYAMIGFEWTAAKFFWYIFVLFFTFLYFTYYGMMAVALTPNHQVAAILASAFYAIFNLFSGFMIPLPKIPKWWVWYYWICPVAWTVNGLLTSQYGDITTTLKLSGGGEQRVDEFLKERFDFHHDFLGAISGALVGFAVFFAFIFAFCIKVLNFQHR